MKHNFYVDILDDLACEDSWPQQYAEVNKRLDRAGGACETRARYEPDLWPDLPNLQPEAVGA